MKSFRSWLAGGCVVVLIGMIAWACGGDAMGTGGSGSTGETGVGGSYWSDYVCGDGSCDFDEEGGETWQSCPLDCCYACACLDSDEACAEFCTGVGHLDLCNGGSASPECAACIESTCGSTPEQCVGTDGVCGPKIAVGPIGCVADIALGASHTCALTTDGSVWCWGQNDQGQLGANKADCPQSSPAPVKDFQKNVVEIALGEAHTCARKLDRSVFCWGAKAHGECSGPSQPFSDGVIHVADLGTSAVGIAAGARHTCARKLNGFVDCWGDNYHGQLGAGAMTSNNPVPLELTALGTGVVEMAAGDSHTCARKGDGTVLCWGDNQYGQIGIGGLVSPQPPVQVTDLGTSAVEIATGESHTCARKADGTVWCWGRNISGQVGDGSTVSARPVPVQVTDLGTSAVEIAAGGSHGCARKADGTVWCWGANFFGQVGDGSTIPRKSPVQVTALGTSAVAIFAGFYNTCARKADGSVWCWGRNTFGQVGDGTGDTPKVSPAQATPACP